MNIRIDERRGERRVDDAMPPELAGGEHDARPHGASDRADELRPLLLSQFYELRLECENPIGDGRRLLQAFTVLRHRPERRTGRRQDPVRRRYHEGWFCLKSPEFGSLSENAPCWTPMVLMVWVRV